MDDRRTELSYQYRALHPKMNGVAIKINQNSVNYNY